MIGKRGVQVTSPVRGSERGNSLVTRNNGCGVFLAVWRILSAGRVTAGWLVAPSSDTTNRALSAVASVRPPATNAAPIHLTIRTGAISAFSDTDFDRAIERRRFIRFELQPIFGRDFCKLAIGIFILLLTFKTKFHPNMF